MYSALTVPGSFRMKGVLAGRETHLIVLLTSVVFLTAWAICIQIFPPTDDVVNFFNNAELMKSGLLPYKDFVFEFPPLSLPLFLIPSIFTSDLTVYTWLFGLEVVISAVVVQYFLMRICEVVGLNRGLVALMFGALVILYFSESLKKFDMMAMLFTVLAFYFFATGRRTLAYAMFAVGAFIKMYPALFIPLLMAMDLSEKGIRGLRDIAAGLMACIAILIISVLPLCCLSVSLSDVFSFMGFHSDRGFQVESFVAIIIQGMSLIGLTSFELIGSHWTYDVVNPICDLLQPYWMKVSVVIIIVSMALALIGFLRMSENLDNRSRFRVFVASTGMILIVFLLVNKVFSTQYTIWLFPIVAILVSLDGRKLSVPMAVIGLAVQFFSVFIVLNDSGSTPFIIANILRDASLIIMLIMVSAYLLFGRGPLRDPPSEFF